MTARHVEKDGSTKQLALPPGAPIIGWSPKTHPTKVSVGLAVSGRKYAIDHDGKHFRWFCTTDGASSLCGYDSVMEAKDGAEATERERQGIKPSNGQPPSLEDQLAQELGGFLSKGKAAQKAVDAELLTAKPFPTSKGSELVSLDLLVEHPKNPRQVFENLDKLADSIESSGGLLIPIVARPIAHLSSPGDDVGAYQIVDGARRYRALLLLAKRKSPVAERVLVDIREMTDAQASEAMMMADQRATLKPLEEAQGYKNMLETGHTAETIAAKLGVSKGTVLGRLKLLELCPRATKLLSEGVLTTAIATPLGRYPASLQEQALALMLEESNREGAGRANLWRRGEYDQRYGDSKAPIKLNVGMAITWLQEHFTKSLKTTAFDQADDTFAVPEELWPEAIEVDRGTVAAPACTVCPKNSNNLPAEVAGENVHGASKAGFCTLPACFDAKWAEAIKRLRAEAKEKGEKILGAAQSKSALKKNPYTGETNGRYARASAINHADPKKRTWGQLQDLANKQLDDGDQIAKVVAISEQGKANLVDTQEVEKVLIAAKAMPKPKANPEGSRTDYEAQQRRQNERMTRRKAVAHDVVRRYAEVIRKKGPTLPLLRQLVDDTDGYDTGDIEVEVFKLKSSRDLDKFVEKTATMNDLHALLFIRAATSSGFYSGYPEGIEFAVDEMKLSLKDLEKASPVAAEDGDE